MSILVIFSHPGPKGHCCAILDEVKKNLDEKNAEYEVIDLYRTGFNPVLKSEELPSTPQAKPEKEILEYQDKIRKADKLVFIHPVWWNGMPALLKGWIDRVFTAGFAYKFENKRPKGLLTDKEAVVFITMGAPKIFASIFSGNRAAKVIGKDILGFCGIRAKVHRLGNAFELNEKQEEKINEMVAKGLSSFV